MTGRSPALTPIERVQNVGLGSVLMTHFGRAYQEESSGQRCGFHTYFLVLPLLYGGMTRNLIKSTHLPSGLSKFTSKLGEHREELLAVNGRVLGMRDLSFRSIAAGVSCRLLSISHEDGTIRANKMDDFQIPERLKSEFAGAEKLGRWCARIPQSQVFSLLQVAV